MFLSCHSAAAGSVGEQIVVEEPGDLDGPPFVGGVVASTVVSLS